ncbi:response regulator transcription factor [Massilia sp. 9096]|uniref:response regulator transcription factor n=1 Tax=Massilia sp. 9096 TaxID=1500894 RepID=UPI00069073CF|nr:response regulator transcription factor [Massilia sp. 9096]
MSDNEDLSHGDHDDHDEERLLLIVEDDDAFARTLGRSFERRGYTVLQAPGLDEAVELLKAHSPGYAVVDLKLKGNSSGLACVQLLHQHDPEMQIVVLTGFASIGTAVEAIKLGACQYLAKPSNTDDIEAAFGHVAGNTDLELTNRTTSVKTLEWEHIHAVLAETDFNISEAARRLGMHRRTLARKLEKQRVK